MPEYNPQIHGPITVNLREIDFVQALTNINSPTFGNHYKSAITAGYNHSYARVIGQYFPKERIKEIKKKMQWPQVQFLIKTLREEKYDKNYDNRSLKQLRKDWKKEEELVLRACKTMIGSLPMKNI